MDGSGESVNILVIGPSQNGKSTFINKIRELSLPTTQRPAEEGDGNSSCTATCSEYDFHFPRTRYKLYDHDQDEFIHVAEEDEETYFSKLWRKKTSEFCEVRPIEDFPRYFNLKVIDTPGLDDSGGSGQDDCNIAEVMGHLHKMAMNNELPNYITALVLILSIQTPFSDHLQKIFRYYERCMPNLFGGLAIVNTNFSAEVWKSRYDENRRKKSKVEKLTKALSADTSKVDTMRERKQDFASIFERDARHFFIDSVPDTRRVVEQLTTNNQMYDIITYLACQSQMPVINIKLYKSPRMAQIDTLLINWLNEVRGDLIREETKLTTHLGEAQAVRARNAKKLIALRNEIEQLEKELSIYNNDEDYTLRTYSTNGQDRASTPGLMGRYIMRTKIKNTYVIKEPDYPGFKVDTYSDEPYARWGKQMFTDRGQTQWAGQYEGTPGHLPVLTAKTLVSNKQFYAKQIAKLKNDITIRSADINAEEKLQRYFLAQVSIDQETLDPTLKKISLRLPEIDDLVNSLNADWLPIEMGINDAARKRYTKDDVRKVDPYDLVEMVAGKGYHALADRVREMAREQRFSF
ncbi:hypothetical protein Dda_9312 [Drechslerella dactyloides]|uniref:G domain-containing protein n=1 Tax=Drechslerella dactyloides TaxID=74499 RepID=A0AAD6IPC8_DREDA|nr:hypothetical protein Dda_9312 [Drechslerella dactyloides]